jgi:flagellar protein FliS
MLYQSNPREAYRRIDLDARVAGADPRQLVQLCYEQLIDALSLALHGNAIADNGLKSRALTRALSALTALRLGIDSSAPVAGPLGQFLDAGRRAILANVTQFDSASITRLRQDFTDIAQAMRNA